MKTSKIIYESGATSHAVNDLILFTDNTPALVKYRDNIYKDWIKSGNFGTAPIWDRFAPLMREAQKQYRKTFLHDKDSYMPIWTMDGNEIAEYCQLYADDFENWKLENDIK